MILSGSPIPKKNITGETYFSHVCSLCLVWIHWGLGAVFGGLKRQGFLVGSVSWEGLVI